MGKGGGAGVVAPAGPTLGARPKHKGAAEDAPPKQRYHNGLVVAQRGEKYIVEKARPRLHTAKRHEFAFCADCLAFCCAGHAGVGRRQPRQGAAEGQARQGGLTHTQRAKT